jgi:hypothetical protein
MDRRTRPKISIDAMGIKTHHFLAMNESGRLIRPRRIFADRAPSYCTAATGRPPVPHTGDKINQINAVSGYYTILT